MAPPHPPVAQVGRNRAMFCRFRADVGRHRAKFGRFLGRWWSIWGPSLAELRAGLARVWPGSVQVRPTSSTSGASVGRDRAKFGRLRANLGRSWPTSGQAWSTSGQAFGRGRATSGRWPSLVVCHGKCWSSLVQVCLTSVATDTKLAEPGPMLVDSAPNLATSGPSSTAFNRSRPRARQIRPGVAQTWAISTRVGPMWANLDLHSNNVGRVPPDFGLKYGRYRRELGKHRPALQEMARSSLRDAN